MGRAAIGLMLIVDSRRHLLLSDVVVTFDLRLRLLSGLCNERGKVEKQSRLSSSDAPVREARGAVSKAHNAERSTHSTSTSTHNQLQAAGSGSSSARPSNHWYR